MALRASQTVSQGRKMKTIIKRLTLATAFSILTGMFAMMAPALSANAATTKPSGTYTVPFVSATATNLMPFSPAGQNTVYNVSDVQAPMYRPMLWMGKGSDITIQNDLSLVQSPVFSTVGGNTVITINTKGWNWSNGAGQTEPVDARSLMFWFNMDKAEASNYANYIPGFGLPDQVKNVVVTSANVLTVTMSGVFNSMWLTYNFLTSVVPMPLAWDITSTGATPGSGGCSNATWEATASGSDKIVDTDPCVKVFNYLESEDVPAHQNDSLWKWSDGPWRLGTWGVANGAATGNISLVPNASYNGPVKAKFAKVQFIPYATETAEIAALQAGKLDAGGVLPTDVTKASAPGQVGTNLPSLKLSNFTPRSGGSWSFDYALYNFGTSAGGSDNPHPISVKGDAYSEINQLYIRQALQYGVDQLGIIKHAMNGYGVPTYGAIPVVPASPESKGITNSYPYSVSKGTALLKAHCWTINTSKASVCSSANTGYDPTFGCGSAKYPILSGVKLRINMLWASGSPVTQEIVNSEQAAWASEGIEVDTTSATANTVASVVFGGSNDWQIGWYGGWIYAPDYYPSGELIFATGAMSNNGGFSDANMDKLISDTTLGTLALNEPDAAVVVNGVKQSYAQYTADILPGLWQPTSLGVGELSKKIKGALAVSPLGNFMPEYSSK